MTYRMIDTNMWLDPWFEEASPDEKLLFVYLFTNPYCSSAGAAQYSHKRLSNETGIPRDRIDVAIEAMMLAGKILVDGDWIACCAFIKHQTRNGNFALSVSKAISEIGSATIRQQVSNLIPTPKQPQGDPKATPNRGKRKTDHTPLQEQDQVQVLEQVQEPKKKTHTSGKPDDIPPGFAEFWEAYPRKVDKSQAAKTYHARVKDGATPEELLLAAQNYAAHCLASKTEVKFIKHPKTFLNPDWRQWLEKETERALTLSERIEKEGLWY